MGAFVLGIPGAQAARHRAGCRRRLRVQDLPLRRRSHRHLGVEEIGRPVKWVAERSESFVSDAGRDHVTHAELALDADGKFLGLRVQTLANMGAYLSTFAPSIPTYLYATLAGRTVHDPGDLCRGQGGVHHTVPVDAYRGAGRPEACYLIERIVENAAREMGIDKTELRRRNHPAGRHAL